MTFILLPDGAAAGTLLNICMIVVLKNKAEIVRLLFC